MSTYTVVKKGTTFQVVRDGTTLVTSYTSAKASGFEVYEYSTNNAPATWNGNAADGTVATFSSTDQGLFGVFDVSAQGRVAQWNGSDAGTPLTPPAPPPPASGLFKPTTAAQLQAAWQAAIAGGYILQLDPTTAFSDSASIVVTGVDYGQQPRGLNGNGALFTYTGTGPAITIQSGPQNTNRGMVLTNFHVTGNGAAGSVGLFINANSPVAIYKFTLRDFYADAFTNGIVIEGNFFESLLDNLQVENCTGDGVVIGDGPGQTIAGIISNVTIQTPNLSRNGGWGLHLTTAKSVDVVAGGSFINNTGGGILAEQGMRRIDGVNVENCGPIAIVLGAAGDTGCKVTGCEFSMTANPAAPEFGGPMNFGIKYTGDPASLLQSGNTVYACTLLHP